MAELIIFTRDVTQLSMAFSFSFLLLHHSLDIVPALSRLWAAVWKWQLEVLFYHACVLRVLDPALTSAKKEGEEGEERKH
jgi:hypothetical protein